MAPRLPASPLWNGRTDLLLPANATFDLQATVEKGEAINDFGSQIRFETDGGTSTLKGNVGGA